MLRVTTIVLHFKARIIMSTTSQTLHNCATCANQVKCPFYDRELKINVFLICPMEQVPSDRRTLVILSPTKRKKLRRSFGN